jgi:hypothetical protein
LHRWQEQAHKRADDGNHDQEFDESESVSIRANRLLPIPTSGRDVNRHGSSPLPTAHVMESLRRMTHPRVPCSTAKSTHRLNHRDSLAWQEVGGAATFVLMCMAMLLIREGV